MDIHKLRKYKYNVRRLKRIDERIDYLCNKDIEVVCGKVVGSSRDFPYTEVRTSVQMYNPLDNDKVNTEIRQKQAEMVNVQREIAEVEEYINVIEDPEIKEIFEMYFMREMRQKDVAKEINIDRSYISKKVNGYLKLSHNSQK